MRIGRSWMGVIAIALLLGCTTTTLPVPLESDSSVGGVVTEEMRVLVSKSISFMPVRASVYEFNIPKGEYKPVAQDEVGVYFQAPLRIDADDGAERTDFQGGLFYPVSFAEGAEIMLYVIRVDGTWETYDLPADFKDPSAGNVVLMNGGEPVPR